jgi:hypothetical protein
MGSDSRISRENLNRESRAGGGPVRVRDNGMRIREEKRSTQKIWSTGFAGASRRPSKR